MANEFVHKPAGQQLTLTEDDNVNRHMFNSQATGDIMIATSATQLSRLAKGTQGYPLIMGASLPQWGGAMKLNTSLNADGQNITNLSYIRGRTTSYFLVENQAVDQYLQLKSGRTNANTGIAFYLTTFNSSDVASHRLTITGGIDTAVATWTAITQVGLVLGGALDVAGQYITFLERAAPGAGAANEVRVYAIVGGDTFTDLAAVFQDGTVDIFAQETTPLDAPIFKYPSGTKVVIALRKTHPGLVKIVAVFPNSKEFVLKELQYHHPDKISANIGTEGPLPADWLIEDSRQISDRLETDRLTKLKELEKIAMKEVNDE